VWAFSYFKELTEGSWLDPYGLRRCDECGLVYGKSKRACQECGTVNPEYSDKKVEEFIHPDDSQYAVMYGMTRCPKCSRAFLARKGGCPDCSPTGYMKKVMTQTSAGTWLKYNGTNPFKGRKL
jgi:uncharacterized OB-fold protein